MIDACTIIAGNYLAAARVLAESFFAQHPEGTFSVLIVDDEARTLAAADALDQRIAWWRLADLGLDAAEIHCLAGIYDVTELSTAVKPLFLRRLVDARQAPVIYLDPDICLFGSLAYVRQLAAQHGLVLTPHVTQPIPDDGRSVDALFVLAAGVYNLGFAAVSPAAAPCLDWWWAQTRRRALNDVERQMFTDQRWADYMPSLFPHHLLKDPGYNVAYWNLHERPLTPVHGRVYARNVPLRFFHFSGYDPRTPWILSRHHGSRPRVLLSEQPVLASLCDDYAEAMGRAGHDACSRRAYGWAISADGLAMTSRIRRLYWSAVLAADRGAPAPPDPFDAEAPGAFTAWLNAADASGPRRWSRYVRAIYDARPDVRAHIPHIDGADAGRFADWLRCDGVTQECIPAALLPAPIDAAAGDAADGERSLREGVHVAGYFQAELGVGEAARLLTRALEASGSAYATTALHAPLSRQQHPFDGAASSPETRFDVNLLCVNADVTPAFAREAGPAFFAGRHTIGYWFWEVEPLPDAMHGAFAHVDEVWAATDYVAAILRAASAGRAPVFTVPLPLLPPAAPSACTREQLGLPADRFVFLFLFDFLSIVERKNPLGVIEAFASAFAPGEGPLLVIKSINGELCVPALEQLRRAAAYRADILIRDGYVGRDEKDALLAACDCYVSLHRAEGLGLTLAEAMTLGKPAIATGYSGNRHFMTDENSFLVDYALAAASGACGPYPAGARWAEPDTAHAARLMRLVYQHPGEAARRAERGREDLLLRHGVMASGAAIEQRLREIRRVRAAASPDAVPANEGAVVEDGRAVSAGAPEAKVPADTASANAAAGARPAADRAAAVAAFAAAMPRLRGLGQPRLSDDERSWQGVRRLAQRAMFRVIRPYWFQQRQFQDALLDAVAESLGAAGTSAGAAPAVPAASSAVPVVTPDVQDPRPAAAAASPSGRAARPFFGTRRDLWASLLIGLCCLLVFNANGRAISAGDAFPTRYQPFAILKHRTVLLDPIESVTSQGRERPVSWQQPHPGAAFWMVPTPGGHLVSLYSVVLPVLITPLYVPAVAYVNYRGWSDDRVDRVARVMEKLTASLLAALSASLLYLALRRRAEASIATLLVIAYALGTTTWVISSQALWQHGMGQLLLVGLILLLTAPSTAPRAIAAGLLCGLIAGNRPADLFLAAPLGLYALYWAGRRALIVCAAAVLPVLLVLVYNVAVVGAISGGYQLVGQAPRFFSHDMVEGLTGLLFSPTRGLFVFSPFLLFVFLAVPYPPRDRGERQLTLAMAAGLVIQLLLYSKVDWRGGMSWGPRFLTEMLPLLIWMLVPVVAALGRPGRALFTAAVAVGIAIEAVGAFAYTGITDAPIVAIADGPGSQRAAWEWRNAPYIASLAHGRAPADILLNARGSLEGIAIPGGGVTDVITAGEDAIATGWALAGRATPAQVGVSIDGRDTVAVREFVDRPDVRTVFPGAAASGWRLPLRTAALPPGEHRLSLYVWGADNSEPRFITRRTLTVRPAPVAASLPEDVDLDAAIRAAAARLREHQQAPGYWLTDFTGSTRFAQPRKEMNTYLTALLVDLIEPLAADGLAGSVQRARQHLTAQIEPGGLVRYHGLPDAPGIGTLGCAITPDTDDTALVWRLAPADDRRPLAAALTTIDGYRTGEGLYRTWLAPRAGYQCLDPGRDPNPADLTIQMHLLQLLLRERPAAGRALCEALRPRVDDDRVWVYYQLAPLVPALRARDLADAGCSLTLPARRLQTTVPEQEIWVSLVQHLTHAARPGSMPDAAAAEALLRRLAAGDFALLRQQPPFLYHNDLTATVPRYYWSEDVGYALWLRLAQATRRLPAAPDSRSRVAAASVSQR